MFFEEAFERKIKRPQAVCLCVLCVLLDQLAVMVVQPLHLLYMSQGVDFCWGAYIFCLIEKFSKKNWECNTRSEEKKG